MEHPAGGDFTSAIDLMLNSTSGATRQQSHPALVTGPRGGQEQENTF